MAVKVWKWFKIAGILWICAVAIQFVSQIVLNWTIVKEDSIEQSQESQYSRAKFGRKPFFSKSQGHKDLFPNTWTPNENSDADNNNNDATGDSNPFSYDLGQLSQARINAPPKCGDTSKKKSNNIAKEHEQLTNIIKNISGVKNYAPFVNRCNLQFSGILGNMEIYEMWLNDKMGYMHNYKAGGTTIQNTLEALVAKKIIPASSKMPYFTNFANPTQRPHRIHLYHINQYQKKLPKLTHEALYNSLNESYLFSYVRDPIDKMLSGFNEMHVRHSKILNKIPKSANTGIENFRYFLKILLKLKNEKLIYNQSDILDKLENRREELPTIYDILPDHHIHPQMYFLTNLEIDHFPFNFIGDMKDIESSLYQIIHYYYDSVNFNDYTNKYYNLKTRKHTEKYYLQRSDLSDQDIEMICQLSWMDYICIPFDMPQQCDIEKLLKQHYGIHVTYDPCYHASD